MSRIVTIYCFSDPSQALAASPGRNVLHQQGDQQGHNGASFENQADETKPSKQRKGKSKERVFLPGGHDIRLTAQVKPGIHSHLFLVLQLNVLPKKRAVRVIFAARVQDLSFYLFKLPSLQRT